jgi:uncharacterized integral membrane protein
VLGLFRWIISTLIVLGFILFAISNMQVVEFTYSPIHEPYRLPLSIIVCVAFGTGLLLGGVSMWVQYGPLSKRAFQKRHERKELRKELKAEKKKAVHVTPEPPTVPMLGSK